MSPGVLEQFLTVKEETSYSLSSRLNAPRPESCPRQPLSDFGLRLLRALWSHHSLPSFVSVVSCVHVSVMVVSVYKTSLTKGEIQCS